MNTKINDTLENRNYSTGATHKWLYFNIHNLVKLRINADHPSTYSFVKSFDVFHVDYIDKCDITLSDNMLLADDYSNGSTAYKFNQYCTRINSKMVDVALQEDEIFISGKRDLLPYVLPLIHWIMLKRGATIIHGASIALKNKGILMPAWGGTGKTSAVIELLKLPESAFMGDDLAFISEDGMLLSYPKPFFIYPYHRNLFPHIFKKKPKIIVPSCLSGIVASIRQTVRPALAAFPRLESLCRRLTPEHMQISARKALPHANFVDKAPLELILFLERYNGSEAMIDQLDTLTSRRRVIGNFYYEMGIHAQELMIACGATGLLGLEDWFGKTKALVDKVFNSIPTYRLRIPTMKPEDTGKAIAEAVNSQLSKL